MVDPVGQSIAVHVDQVFANEPDSAAMQKLFSETLEKTGAKPRYVVSDKGRQFECRGFFRSDAPYWSS